MDDEFIKKIKEHYALGQGSIQDIARVYRLSVDEVLQILEMQDMMTVETTGDMISQDEAGNEVTINTSHKFKVPYTTD